jgi:phage terminase large subunit-like protein
MRVFAARAQKMPALGAMFRAYYLNQPIRAEAQWLNLDLWDEGATLRALPAAGRRCYGGLDLASKSDLTALALWFPNDDGSWELHIECWCPAARIEERSRADRVPYTQWREAGWLTATPGNSTDYGFVEKRIYELMKTYTLVELGVDPWNARDLTTRLGQNSVPVVEVPQTLAQLTTPAKELERLILTRKLRHRGSPLVRWTIGNAVAVIDAYENVRPDKRRSTDKIDPVTAAITGLAGALLHESHGPSVYERRGVVAW